MGVSGDGIRQHIYPLSGRLHVLAGTACWCGPDLKTLCGQCDGDGCWRCDHGAVPATIPEDALLVIHRKAAP